MVITGVFSVLPGGLAADLIFPSVTVDFTRDSVYHGSLTFELTTQTATIPAGCNGRTEAQTIQGSPLDFLTGEEHWRKHRIKHGTIVLADGYLYLLTQKGELQIGKATPDDFVPTTTAPILSGRCWTVPVIHDGKLIARNLERVVCFSLK